MFSPILCDAPTGNRHSRSLALPRVRSPARTLRVAAKATAQANLFAVIGTDEGLVKDRARKIYAELTGGNDDGFTHETIDGNATNAEEAYQICSRVIQALQTLPMFGGAKVVWLRNATFLGADRTSDAERTLDGVTALRVLLEAGLPDDVSFIISATKVDMVRLFGKFLKANAKLETHDLLDSGDDWQEAAAVRIDQRAQALGLQFEDEARELMALLAGGATLQIDNELEKIDLYLGERRTVTSDDVRQLVPLSRAGIVFEIGNALQKGDLGMALDCIDQQLDRGESAIGIMRATIIPTIRNLFMARLLLERGNLPQNNYSAFAGALDRLDPIERAWLPQKKAGGVNAYPIFLALRAASAFTMVHLRKAMEAALQADQSLVSTSLDHRLVLHRVVAELAQARKR